MHAYLEHQFEDLAQQKEAATLGMWVFLATEVMFFGGAFLGYAVYRATYPHAFALASQQESWWIGAFNTGVLLCSSYTVALCVHAAHHGNNRGVIRFLLITIGLAALFIGIKLFEYSRIIAHHHAPWDPNFAFEPSDAGGARLFFSFYFGMTGIHALHMVVGIGLMLWLILRARRNEFSGAYYTPVEVVGLYWHFVDIVWIFLYPLFYLIDPVFFGPGH